jgi:hypothetical protein
MLSNGTPSQSVTSCETGLVALSRGHGAHYQLDSAFRKHGDFGALAWSTARDLDVIRDADTSQLAVLSRCGLAGCKSIPIGERPCRVHRVLVAAAVVPDTKRVSVWLGRGRDYVLAAPCDRVESQLVGC